MTRQRTYTRVNNKYGKLRQVLLKRQLVLYLEELFELGKKYKRIKPIITKIELLQELIK